MPVRYEFDPHAFGTPSPERDYWAGFLMADGNIARQRPALSVGLQLRDLGHLHKFREFLKSQHPVHIYPNGPGRYIARLGVQSAQLVRDLAVLGIHPAKTYTAEATPEMAASRDFWRGMMDGDGSIIRPGHAWGIRLNGTPAICEQFRTYLKDALAEPMPTVAQRRGTPAVAFALGGAQKTRRVLRLLYAGADVALDRKQALWTELAASVADKSYRTPGVRQAESGLWRAFTTIDGRTHYLGSFPTQEGATVASRASRRPKRWRSTMEPGLARPLADPFIEAVS